MDDAADLILRLLKSHPLSPQSPPEVSSAQSGQDGAQVASKHNPVGSTTAEVASQAPAASPCSEQWPTPKASQWQDIELVATRACIALGWALSPGVVHHAEEAVWSLAAQLYQLVQRLVIGHLLDLDLCVRKLFRLGLHPILRFHIDGHAESTSLTVAMLSRMAMDCSAIAVGWLHAEQICLIFCKWSTSNNMACNVLQAAQVPCVSADGFGDVNLALQSLFAGPSCYHCRSWI